MYKNKAVNVPLLFFGLIGCVIAYILGELLLTFLSPLPYSVQAGLYMVFAIVSCGAVILISEFIASGGYVQHWREKFARYSIRAWLLFIPIAFIVGLTTQFLYGFAGVRLFEKAEEFQGSYLVCDISGSMNDNDPEHGAADAMLSYIDEVPIGDHLGVILYNHEPQVIRSYKAMGSEDERAELKSLIAESATYEGGTDTQSALLEAISEIREIPGEHPGIIILFSDGLSDVNYSEIQDAARGDKTAYDIPVNTVFYSSSSIDGYQLSTIAQVTGGVFNYLDTKESTEGIFSQSRFAYSAEKLFLLNASTGDKKESPIRIILQSLFIAVWCFTAGLLVVAMLDNKNLIRDFLYPRIATSIITGILFTILLNTVSFNMGMLIRFLPMFCMVVLLMPTYKITSRG